MIHILLIACKLIHRDEEENQIKALTNNYFLLKGEIIYQRSLASYSDHFYVAHINLS